MIHADELTDYLGTSKQRGCFVAMKKSKEKARST